MSTPSGRSARRGWLYLAAITLLALALRLCRLDYQNVWYDEAFSITACMKPLAGLTDALLKDWGHPPLYFYLLHGWQAVFGFGAFQSRLLSVVFGTLSIPMIYLLAEFMFDRGTAVAASLLLAVSHLGVMYSQEARPYAQLLFFVLATIYCFARAIRERSGAWCVLLAICTAAMLYTHYYAWFVFAILLAAAAAFHKRYGIRWSWCLIALAGAIVCYLPWLATGVASQALHSGQMASASPQSSVHLASAVYALNWFNNGKVSGARPPSPVWSFPAGLLLFTTPALLALQPVFRRTKADPGQRGTLLLVFALALVPVVLVLAISSVTHIIYFVRYIAFCIGPYYLLTARGIAALKSRALLLAAICLYSGAALHAQYTVPYKGEDREALYYLVSAYRGGDCTVFRSSYGGSNLPLQWPIYRLPRVRAEKLETVAGGASGCDRVWFVWRYPFWESRETATEERLCGMMRQRYQQVSGKTFEGMSVRLFQLLPSPVRSPGLP